MKMSNLFMPTLREKPAEADIVSHQLMLRAAMIHINAAGVYQMLPLGYRVFRKIENIIREEMDNAGAQELHMNVINPAELYMKSGRWNIYGPEMFKLRDRNGRDFCLGPTHEESFTEVFRFALKSYRDMPKTLYQIQTKFRDERRPRFGVIRSREFTMKDAYSFDRDMEGLDKSYRAMYEAYVKIFNRCGLDFLAVDADNGAMGGSGSQEFMVKSDIGEAVLAVCPACGYGANDEKAPCAAPEPCTKTDGAPLEKVLTPDVKTVEALVEFFGAKPENFAKTMIYKAGGKVVAVMVRGDREINETKLSNRLGGAEVSLADAETVFEATSAKIGFAGPIGLKADLLLMDSEVAAMYEYIVGACDTGYHYKNVVTGRDFKPDDILDLRNITEGEPCPVCGKPLTITHGIEVGHIFKLGDKYTRALDATYLDENGETKYPIMGCYGIGLNRTMASIIEQNYDENGIIWPIAIAPYHVSVIPARMDNLAEAEAIYEKLNALGCEALLDDRDERTGVKFKDCDLIGIPMRIVAGKKISDGIVELKSRDGRINADMSIDEAINTVAAEVKAALAK